MVYLRKLFILFVLTVFFCSTLFSADDLVLQGKKAVEKTNWQQAATIFWQAAQKGNLEAINYLSAIYIISKQDFDREIFDTNIPAVVEKLFPCENESKSYTGKFVIIASENAINEKALKSIKKRIEMTKLLLKSTKWSAILGGPWWMSVAGLWKGDKILKVVTS